ncbi:MFS transporter [Streptomyces sp. NPDC088116]|uniref:MFS transporter n=1 Tax=Streptomyces sp. NPDC088116 TaxID=3365825 RepID=UPI00380BB320
MSDKGDIAAPGKGPWRGLSKGRDLWKNARKATGRGTGPRTRPGAEPGSGPGTEPDSGPRTGPDTEPGSGSGAPDRTMALAAMLFAVSMTFIDQTIVAVAAPDIVHDLGFSATAMQWVFNVYLLALAAFFALGGRLSGIFGHRRVMLIGTLVFVISSVFCALVPAGDAAPGWLIAFRATQGVGAALMFPAALAVVIAVFPVDRRGRALGLFFWLAGALTVLGPLLGGWLTAWSWRAIFWINVPVAAIALVLTAKARIPDTPRREPLDLPGAVLVAAGMGLSVLGLQQSAVWGWGSAATWACLVIGVLLLVAFCRYELSRSRRDHPLLGLRAFRDRGFAVDAAVLFFAMTAFVPVFFFASVYSQVSLSASPQQAGLYLLYFFVGFAFASYWGDRVQDRYGARPALLLGTALGTLGFALWASKTTQLSMHDQWPYVALSGAGIGFLLAPASTDAVHRVIGAPYEEVTALTQTVRTFAACVGVALFGTVLMHTTTNRVAGTLQSLGVPGDPAHNVGHTIAEAVTGNGDTRVPTGSGPIAQITRELIGDIRLDFAEANRAVFYGMAIALAIAFVCALFHPGGRVGNVPSTGPAVTGPSRPTGPAGPRP